MNPRAKLESSVKRLVNFAESLTPQMRKIIRENLAAILNRPMDNSNELSAEQFHNHLNDILNSFKLNDLSTLNRCTRIVDLEYETFYAQIGLLEELKNYFPNLSAQSVAIVPQQHASVPTFGLPDQPSQLQPIANQQGDSTSAMRQLEKARGYLIGLAYVLEPHYRISLRNHLANALNRSKGIGFPPNELISDQLTGDQFQVQFVAMLATFDLNVESAVIGLTRILQSEYEAFYAFLGLREAAHMFYPQLNNHWNFIFGQHQQGTSGQNQPQGPPLPPPSAGGTF
ncbi:hypothetical protein niasHT_031150 [Heterodera trifolii]|uniref:Uncharacterized protein n=1 Tax=Heterodera trifolii TaxID=157864 RepID=A0ABD2IX90_9BILA